MQILTKGGSCRIKLSKPELKKLADAQELLGHLARNLQDELGDVAAKAQQNLVATIVGVAKMQSEPQLELPLEGCAE